MDRGRVIAHGTPEELKRIVGGRTLQVRPANQQDSADVGALLTRISGRKVEEPAKGMLAVPVEDSSS